MGTELKRDERKLFIEEMANSITHGIGLALSLAGMAILIFYALAKGSRLHIIGCGVYGMTLVMVYAASTVYHTVRKPNIKDAFRVCDQVAIYLVIAGTYTPFTLINLKGPWGWILFTSVWSLSLFGIAFKIIFVNRYKAVSIVLYVIIGWLAIIAAKPIIDAVPLACLMWILGGGIAYMAGLIFFAWERLPFNHTIWHVFVMIGSLCHYLAVMFYVLPVKA